ncbi:hypothetical protein [Mycolicibacterium sp.]|uniref:hypothetical protein n=1 Tax=Mycolicibacterium sp. TaxID=2320850 RepID=UPI003D09B1E6
MPYPSATGVPDVGTRLVARLRATTFDHRLAVGVIPRAGAALAVHAERLRSDRERRILARVLRQAVEQAESVRSPSRSAVRLHRQNIRAAADVIAALIRRLQGPQPVNPMGMARVRRILADGQGPMYHGGTGDLTGRLSAALAAL